MLEVGAMVVAVQFVFLKAGMYRCARVRLHILCVNVDVPVRRDFIQDFHLVGGVMVNLDGCLCLSKKVQFLGCYSYLVVSLPPLGRVAKSLPGSIM